MPDGPCIEGYKELQSRDIQRLALWPELVECLENVSMSLHIMANSGKGLTNPRQDAETIDKLLDKARKLG